MMENVEYLEPRKASAVNAEVAVGRAEQEVKAMVFMAKTYPRDETAALNKILKSCERPSLAKTAMYEYPKGGTKVTGPSIRLAEAIAQNWGNIDFGMQELEQHGGESSVMAYAWDLETNTRQTKVFTQKHERKSKGRIDKLTDPREIYELVANNGARRVRACILGIIPGDIVEAAVEKCQDTIAKNIGSGDKLQETIKKMIDSFTVYNVTKEMLEKFCGCKTDAFSQKDVVRLSGVYASLRDGMSKPDQYFDVSKPKTEPGKETILDKEFQNGTK
jgi:hypothetical protein